MSCPSSAGSDRPGGPGAEAVARAIGEVARRDGGRVVAVLAGRTGDAALADDAVQDALVAAWEHWPVDGVPDNPAGWLATVAQRRALDRLRREASIRRRTLAAASDLVVAGQESSGGSLGVLLTDDDGRVADDQLRLLLLCTHPALRRDAQIALTLRLAGGLSTPEVAAAFLVPEATMAQRIVRAKAKIRAARIPLSVPDELAERVDVLLTVLLLIFNEGWLARSEGGPLRVDLLDEAVRLTELLATLLPEQAEVRGLLAQQWFLRSREATRFDADGALVTLDVQDRTRWDLSLVERGNSVLASALRLMAPGPFQVRALIAAEHANARTAADTQWPHVVTLYGQLVAMTGSPVDRLNHAVAVAMADGPEAGLRLLDGLTGLDGYHLLWAARGELLSRAGRADEAAEAFRRALALVGSAVERRHLEKRLATAR